MNYHITEEFFNKKGIISNEHGFFNRHLDTGFNTKWSGYWTPPYKFLDYYGIKINGIWLNQKTLAAVDYGQNIVFHHETESLYIKEIIETPPSTNGFNIRINIENKTSDPKAAHLKLETGVDIRKRNIDIPSTNYKTQKEEKSLKIKNQDKKLIIESEKDFNLSGGSGLKEHVPREKQVCYLPGYITFREEIPVEDRKEVKVSFRTFQGDKTDNYKDLGQELEGNKFERPFRLNYASLKNLTYSRKEPGIAAGHPWFQNFWGQDTFWSLLGLIDMGEFELSHTILENYTEKEGFPTRIYLEGKKEYQGGDEPPLFVIASEKLERHYKISEVVEEKQQEAFEELKMNKENHVVHSPEASWMDTLNRKDPAVENQSLWLQAARVKGERELASKLKQGLNDFIEDDYIKNNLVENSPITINPTVPLFFDQVEREFAEKALETINRELSSRYGARTLSFAEPGYQANGYHTGSVWGLTTCWAAMSNLQHGKYRQGISFLEKLVDFLDRNQLGSLPEVVNAENGSLMGCSEQAWSASLFNHAIDSYMLGIKPKNGKLVVEPSGPVSGVRRGKRIGDEKIDIEFKDGKVEVLDEPNIDVEVNYF